MREYLQRKIVLNGHLCPFEYWSIADIPAYENVYNLKAGIPALLLISGIPAFRKFNC